MTPKGSILILILVSNVAFSAPFTPLVEKPSGLLVSVILVMAAIVSMGLWTLIGRSMSYRKVGREAKNLFLKISYSCNHKEEVGIIRSLDIGTASMVSKDSLKKGDQILLRMGTLPNFPGKFDMNAEIVGTRPVQGDSSARLINLKFEDSASLPIDSLGYYLDQLSR